MDQKGRLVTSLLLSIPVGIGGLGLLVWVNRLIEAMAPPMPSDANWLFSQLDWLFGIPEALDEWLISMLQQDALLALIVACYAVGVLVCKPAIIALNTSTPALLSATKAPPEVKRMSDAAIERAYPGWRGLKKVARARAIRRSYGSTALGALKAAGMGALMGLVTVATRHLAGWSTIWGGVAAVVLVLLLLLAVLVVQELSSAAAEEDFDKLMDALES